MQLDFIAAKDRELFHVPLGVLPGAEAAGLGLRRPHERGGELDASDLLVLHRVGVRDLDLERQRQTDGALA